MLLPLGILEERGMLNSRPLDTPMHSNVKLMPNQAEPYSESQTQGDIGD